jgi:hypothetical protein
LQKIHPELYFEFSLSPGTNELIITADGNAALFPIVQEIVQAAPEIEGWQVFALKPKLGFPETTRWEAVTIRIADVRFQPIHDDNGDLELLLYVPHLETGRENDAHNALLRAMDHGVGERRFAENVQYTAVRSLDTLDENEQSFPLTYLDEYLSERQPEV